MSSARLIWITPEAEKIITYCARVSNPQNQDSDNIRGLLRYCYKHKHWSIFEMANMCVEIKTYLPIITQIIRHKSFSFQGFSARYAILEDFNIPEPRRQDEKNRQNSIDDLPTETVTWFKEECFKHTANCYTFYKEAIKKGIARESARFILPQTTISTIYMSGCIRSWIHYLQTRTKPDTQLEHREVAFLIKDIFVKQLPIVGELLDED